MSSERVLTLCGFYVLKQNETGVCLTLGKYSGTVSPGLGFAIPFIQQIRKTVSSLQTIDLPDQQIVLSGNISVTISAISTSASPVPNGRCWASRTTATRCSNWR